MGKIDTLKAEIQKQSVVYGDILVGMHADITDYKKKVELQSETTDNVLQEVQATQEKVEVLRTKAKSLMDQSVKLFRELNRRGSDVMRIAREFDTRLENFSDELAHYKSNLSQREEALVSMVKAYKSEVDVALVSFQEVEKRSSNRFRKLTITMLIFFIVNLMLVGYLYRLLA